MKKGERLAFILVTILLITFIAAVAPVIVFNSQSPADINTTSSLIGIINITYNITGEINLSTVKLYYKHNVSDADYSYYVNGSATTGYQNKNYTSNNSEVFLFQLFENQLLPGTVNLENSVFDNQVHKNVTIEAWNHAVEIEILNVSNSSEYGFFEVMVEKEHSWTSVGDVIYCNSSYIDGYFLADDNCAEFASLNANDYSHSHANYSKHVVIPFSVNTTTGKIGNVKVTSESSFIIRASGPYGWVVHYIKTKTRTNASRTTTGAGTSWTELNGTFDAHLHQYDGTDQLFYYACASDNSGNENCTNDSIITELYTLGGLPPTGMNIFSPTINSSHNGNITINYTKASSPNAYNITSYNISYGYTNGTRVGQIVNNSLDLSYIWNTSSITEGEYFIVVEACDNMSQCTNTSSYNFYIDRTDPSITFSCSPTSVNTGATISCSCSATDSLSGVNSTSHTTNPSTSTTGTFSTTCTSIDNANNSVTSSISYTVSSSSSSSSGGASYSYTSDISEGSKIERWLREKDSVSFKIKSSSHSLKILEINDDEVLAEVSSDPINITMRTNESVKVDLDSDGYYDLLASCLSTLTDRTKVRLEGISEKVPEDELNQATETEGTDSANGTNEETY